MSEGKWGKRIKHNPNPEIGKNAMRARVLGGNDGNEGDKCGKCFGEVYIVCSRVLG